MVWLLVFLLLASPALAVVNPQSGSAAVTATVPADPDTPVLISPANNATISTTAPSFIFNPAGGEVIINHYQLWIDGHKDTSPIRQSLSTIVTQALTALTEGSHIWSITAVADNGRTRNSTTWTFTIDITAPLILVNQVAEHQTSLSSLDLTPWQKEVSFTTSDRYPIIKGQSEALAFLTINFSGTGVSETVSTTIGADRLFSLKPNIALPLGRYAVAVSSSDAAGNNTSLPSFYVDIVAPTASRVTISLPPPLPDFSFTVPVIVPPTLPQIITAFPLTPSSACPAYAGWPWLIIILLIIYIIISKRRR
ncbi:MAG: hypothetical protein U1C50_02870 [Patescibacteria group bacterium]|nr:hypothetical protein [Patescibacteria group bacterium]